MKILRAMCAAGGLLSTLAAGAAVQASPIAYEGVLTLGQTQVYQLPQRTSNWWSFEAEAGDQVVITVHRLENSFDSAFNLYFGHGSGLELVASADNEVDQLEGYEGRAKDAQYILTAANSGTYSIEIYNALPNAGGKDKAFDYQISFASYVAPSPISSPDPLMGVPLPPQAIPISEPATTGVLGAGLLGLTLLRRARRKG